MSASARMNRYELAKRVPDFALVEKLAIVLEVPTLYFYARDDELADLIVRCGKLNDAEKDRLIKLLDDSKY